MSECTCDDFESFMEQDYFMGNKLTKNQLKRVIKLMEPARKYVETSLDDYDAAEIGWRDYSHTMIENIRDYYFVKEIDWKEIVEIMEE